MLALIAGRGKLPAVLVDSLKELPFIASPEGFDPDFLVPDRRFRIEELGTLLEELRALGVAEVCFAGAIRRPDVDPARIDAATRPLVPRLMAALGRGDDWALREVLAIFEEAGFTIRAAHEILPALLPDKGVHTKGHPGPGHEGDADRAAEVVAGLGTLDIGQAVAVKAGQALAIEGVFGTDWMLASLRHRPDNGGGLLYKAAKPGQDRRVDLPTIGMDTITAAKRAGLDGIVVAQGEVMVLDIERVARVADKAGLFLWVR